MTTTHRPETTVEIELTDQAAAQVQEFLAQEDVPQDTAGLRVAVMPGGRRSRPTTTSFSRSRDSGFSWTPSAPST